MDTVESFKASIFSVGALQPASPAPVTQDAHIALEALYKEIEAFGTEGVNHGFIGPDTWFMPE